MQAAHEVTGLRAGLAGLAGGLALLVAWGVLFADLLGWLLDTLGHDDFRLNLLLLLGLGSLVARRALVQPGELLDRLAGGPRPAPLPLTLAALGALGWLVVDYRLDIDILSAALFGLGSYGLLGLYMEPARWRAGAPAALLLIGALPFGTHLDIYLGFPARVATAELVQQALSAAGYAVDGAQTILLVESRAASVDLPCSGVRSLWVGGLFFLAATWLERRRLGAGWLAVGLAFVALLFGANALRVLALVTLDSALGLERAARIAHVPLGVLGFVGACGAAWWLLRLLPAIEPGRAGPARRPRPWLAPALAAAALALALLHTPRPLPAVTAVGRPLPPAWLDAVEVPLTRQEADLFLRHGAGRAGKWRFDWQGVHGSMLLVYSDSWRAHHPPELCLQGAGLVPGERRTWLIAPDFPLSHLSLDGGARSASYWFQSADQTTDDFSARAWAGLVRDEGWVLVSLLFDGPQAAGDPALTALYEAIHDSVDASLMDG